MLKLSITAEKLKKFMMVVKEQTLAIRLSYVELEILQKKKAVWEREGLCNQKSNIKW